MTSGRPADRRRHARRPAADLPWLRAVRLRPGLGAGLDVGGIEYTPGGALVETTTRIRPGMKAVLQLTAGEGDLRAPGEVARAWVSAILPDRGVLYRGALRFDRRMDLPAGGGQASAP